MTSDTVTNAQLSLPAGVTLDGNNKTLTHLSNPTGTAAGNSAAILVAPETTNTQVSTVKKIKIDGPNTTPATTNTDGTVTRNLNSGEYAIKALGEGAKLVVQNVTISRAQSALMASKGAQLTVKGTLEMKDVEYGGIEVSEDSNSELILDSTASFTYEETADTPFAWIDNGGKITNNTDVDLAKVKVSETKNHFYLNCSDAKGAHLYTNEAIDETGKTTSQISLGGKHEFALLKFTPSTSGTFCFASSGTIDATAEVYNVTSTGALGTKVTSEDTGLDKSFKVFAKLTAGSTYILRVGVSDSAAQEAQWGDISVTAAKASTTDLSSYKVSLPANTYYYSDENLTKASTKLTATVKSAIDGTTLAASKYNTAIYKVESGSVGSSEVETITEAGKYALKVTPSSEAAATTDSLTGTALCYFEVKDVKDISNYDFKYNKTLVFDNNQVAELTSLAPKGYRYGSNQATFTEDNIKFIGWYSVVDGVKSQTPLTTAPSAVGDYVLTISPVDGTTYTVTSTIDLVFSITKGVVTVPSVRSGLTYTGSAQTGVAAGANYTLSGILSATNAGNYTCTATLADGYKWSDGTEEPKTFNWSIARAKIDVPVAKTDLVYDGKAQTGVAAGTGYAVTGTSAATKAGDYTAVVTPGANYSWADGTTVAKTLKWSIAKAKVAVPSATVGLIYNGKVQTGVAEGTGYTVTGTSTATNAGDYTAIVTPVENYAWTDGTTTAKTVTWSIAKAKVAAPSANTNLVYNGKAQTGVVEVTGYSLTGTSSATEPGDYIATATLADNYAWSDGTTAAKVVNWTIAKAAANVTAQPSSAIVKEGGKTTVTLSQVGDGAYTAASSDSRIASATVTGSSVTITAVSSGTATITVSTAETAHYAAGTASITVNVSASAGERSSATTTVTDSDGNTTKVTNKVRVTTEYDASSSNVTPTVAFTGSSVTKGKALVPSKVTLSDGITYKVTSIASKAFSGTNISSISIPTNVTVIGSQAFRNCTKLKTITLHSKIKSIGSYVLKGAATKTVTIKTSKLSKTSIKNLVKGSKLTTIKCSGLSKSVKAKYAKWVKAYKASVKVK